MSDNRLNLTGLTYFYNRLKQVFATQTALSNLSERVDDIVAEGGEPNVIETVKVDGTALVPDAQKAVNIDLSGKQDTLVSGTNIKTINSLSLLGSGNIDINDVFVATVSSTTYAELDAAVQDGKAIFLKRGSYLIPTLSVVLSSSEIGYVIAILDSYGGQATLQVYSLSSADEWQMRNSYSLATVQNLIDGLATKQDTLVSGTSIKTINNESLLGNGNIAVGGAIDTISVNGTQQTITNKNVDLNIPLVDVPTDASRFEIKTMNDDPDAPLPVSSEFRLTPNTNGIITGMIGAYDVDPEAVTEFSIYSKDYIDSNLATKASVPTKVSDLTNDGDGTTGSTFPTTAQMQTAIDAKISSAYKVKGSVAFANLPALAAANEGNVYDVTDSFTTTADFVEGAGNTYPAGTNVVIINTGTEQSPVYKYDVLAGFVDLSDYWNNTNLTAITTAEIDAMMAS